MRILTRYLQRGDASSQAIEDDASVLVVCSTGGDCSFETTGRASSVWIPLHGQLRVHNTTYVDAVRSKELLITEYDDHVKTVARGNGVWLAMLAGRLGWGQLLADTAAADPQLLPDHSEAGPRLRRLTIALARAMPGFEREGSLRDTADAIVALQAPLREMVSRCPGRTFAERRRVFVRLQRARRFIRTRCHMELDNAALADLANYSTGHFLRTFNAVFQETPHACLVGQRLQRAARLLHTGTLAVTEVALASGFESPSAFSRLFHQRFGMTATEARRQCDVVTRSESVPRSRTPCNATPDFPTSRHDAVA